MMRGSDQEELDQSRNSGMEDNPTMTIEYLRARLLAERSASRAARQRAGELANRVAEMEEQLKIVCTQRKDAEKATEDLLKILENHGITDASEPYDSSSDQEREEDSSSNSNLRRNDSDTYSGSELDSATVAGGSLSWKGRKNSPHSLEKYKRSMRRGCSFASFGSSSTRHCQGKSCRQIKRRESRSVDQDSESSSMKVGGQENGVAMTSEFTENSCDAGSENMGDQLSETKDQRALTKAISEHNVDSYERNKETKEALEDQAQLTDRYEAMEKAQREWEEKFRQNCNPNQELFDPGNQSDITEERDDCKEQLPSNSGALCSQILKVNSDLEGACVTKEQSIVLADDCQRPSKAGMNQLQNRSPGKKFAENSLTRETAERNLPSSGSSGKGLTNISSTVETSGHKHENYALVPHKKPSELDGVLDALKQAKLSLLSKITKLETREGAFIGNDMNVAEPTLCSARPWERSEIPVGCAGLFRIPSDFTVEIQSQPNILVKSSELRLTNYHHHHMEVAAKTGDRFMMESVSRSSSEDPLLGNEFKNTNPTIPPLKPYLSSCLDVSLPTSSKHAYSSYNYVPDLMPQKPSTEQVFGHPLERVPSRRSVEHFSFTNDRGNPNVYRW